MCRARPGDPARAGVGTVTIAHRGNRTASANRASPLRAACSGPRAVGGSMAGAGRAGHPDQRVMMSPSSDTVGRPEVPATRMRIVRVALVDQAMDQTIRRACAVEAYVSTVRTFTPSM